MSNSKEMVTIEKEVLENLLATIQDLQEKVDNIDHYVQVCTDMIGAIAEKLHCA